ncbi:resolvase-like protein [Dyadobacter jejuensis]|uniref:Resolvase-like protein n=1 Tax=Dyadobacter jejuensis TaxID=1082580 RepID=A0A316AKF4_9BACT|nr:resolvase-like protein [Dyadobacter jejuensis]
MKSDRPQLAAMQQILREGDVIYIYKLDRLGRSLKHLLEMTSDFEKRGIGLVSINDHIDITTAQGRFIFNIFASLAEFEET